MAYAARTEENEMGFHQIVATTEATRGSTGSSSSPVILYMVPTNVTAQQNARVEQPKAGPYVRAVVRLQKLQRYERGWDGSRSVPANTLSFELAIKFLNLLSARSHQLSVHPNIFSPGTAVLELVGESVRAVLEFASDGLIAANIDTADDKLDLDIPGFTGESIPHELEQYF